MGGGLRRPGKAWGRPEQAWEGLGIGIMEIMEIIAIIAAMLVIIDVFAALFAALFAITLGILM